MLHMLWMLVLTVRLAMGLKGPLRQHMADYKHKAHAFLVS